MPIQRITSTSNPHVKRARKLQRKRRRDETGLCLLEGERLVWDAWRAGAVFDALFLDAERLATQRDDALLMDLRRAGVELFAVSPGVLAHLSQTVTPQGIIALAHIPRLPPPPSPQMILVLDGIRDPGNGGTLLRSAAAAGVDLVLFGPETVDPFGGKVLRAAMGAHFRIPLRTCQAWTEIDSWLGSQRAVYVADAHAAQTYDAVDWAEPAALVVGGEAQGPSPAAHRRAAPVVIPMQRGMESLNAAVAGSVILFEAARQRRRVGL